MISNDSNISNLTNLLRDVCDNAGLRLRFLRLDFVGKLSVLLSALVLGIVLAIIGAVALLFVAYTAALLMAPAVGGLHVACGIVVVACLLLGWGVYALRSQLIVRPLTAFIARLLLDKRHLETEKDKEATP